jgi:hypothetical protein
MLIYVTINFKFKIITKVLPMKALIQNISQQHKERATTPRSAKIQTAADKIK